MSNIRNSLERRFQENVYAVVVKYDGLLLFVTPVFAASSFIVRQLLS